MQTIIEILLKEQHRIKAQIRTLPYSGLTESMTLTRLQIFMLVASMFLSLMPAQCHTDQTSFIELMTTRPSDKNHRKSLMRL
jgi:hypothetical protein